MSKEAALRRLSGHLVGPFVAAAGRLHLSPNALTVVGLVISLVSAGLVGAGHLLVGGIVMLFSSAFDLLDGAVARASNRISKFGGLLDSLSDRISEGALLCALLVLYTTRGSTPGVLFTVAALIGSFLTSYIRARAEGLGIECRIGIFTRVERVVVLGAGLVLDGLLWHKGALAAVIVITIFSWVTVVQRLAHVWKQTRGREENGG